MKINFLGDSITAGTGSSTREKRYVNIVGTTLGCEVRNYGVSGTRFARQKTLSESAAYDYDFQMRMEVMFAMDGDADKVFVFGGTNDFDHGDVAIGDTDSRDPYTFCGGLNTIIEYLLGRYGREKICFLLPTPRFNQDKIPLRKQGIGAPLDVYVKIMKDRLELYKIDYIDLFHGCLPVPQTDTGDEYTIDGLHPNDNGHRFIADKILKYLTDKCTQ